MLGGLVSSIVAGAQARKAGNAALADYNQKLSFLDNTFNRQYYSDITKRTDVQNMMRLLQENQEQQAKRDEAIAAISGATPEAKLASQDSRNKSYANAMAEIASNASQLKDAYLQNYQNQRLNLVNPQAQVYQNTSNQWSQAGTNLFGLGSNMLGQTDWSKLGTGTANGGGSVTANDMLNSYKNSNGFYNHPKG